MTDLLIAEDPALASSPRLADVTALLDTLVLPPDQQAVADRMRAHAGAHDDALHRTCPPGHFTGSALVVDASGERLLLLFHRKLQRWLQPGGHADGDGNVAAVALREATEETGIQGLRIDPVPLDLDIHEVRPPGEPPHMHLDVRFLVVAPEGAALVGNHESEELRWFDVGELGQAGIDDGTYRLIAAGLARFARV